MIVISIANSMLKSKEKGGMKVLKKYNQKTVRQSDYERMKKIGQNAIKERNQKNQHTFVTRSW